MKSLLLNELMLRGVRTIVLVWLLLPMAEAQLRSPSLYDRDYKQALSDYNAFLKKHPGHPQVSNARGDVHFFLGMFKESIADYDVYLEVNPKEFPYHWKRGISCYYSGDFEKGVAQFESHKAVNPHDVENAVWHFICKARAESLEAARKDLIPIEGDGRIPMMKVHALFAGKATPEDVLQRAEDTTRPGRLKIQRFYAHLYLGIYYEIIGDKKKAVEHIDLAAIKFFDPHYMGEVAKVHKAYLDRLYAGD